MFANWLPRSMRMRLGTAGGERMESLAMMVAIIMLVLILVFFVGLFILWRIILNRYLPTKKGKWWFLWTPMLVVVAYGFMFITIQIIMKINA